MIVNLSLKGLINRPTVYQSSASPRTKDLLFVKSDRQLIKLPTLRQNDYIDVGKVQCTFGSRQ